MDRFVDYAATKRGMAARCSVDAGFNVFARHRGRSAARSRRCWPPASRPGCCAPTWTPTSVRAMRAVWQVDDAERARRMLRVLMDGLRVCPIGRHAAQLVRGTADHWVHDEPVPRLCGPDGASDLRAQVPVAGLRADRARALRALLVLERPGRDDRVRGERTGRRGLRRPRERPRAHGRGRPLGGRARRGRAERSPSSVRWPRWTRRTARSSAWTGPGRRRARRCSRPSGPSPRPVAPPTRRTRRRSRRRSAW